MTYISILRKAMRHHRMILVMACIANYTQLSAQQEVAILSVPFRISVEDSNYRGLEKKMPGLICSGLLYRSDLHLVGELEKETSFSRDLRIGLNTLSADLNHLKANRLLLDSLRADYFMDGEIGISGDQFSLNVKAADFSGSLISYNTTKLYPLSNFQRIVDEASESINRQIHLNTSGKKSRKVLIDNFFVRFGKKIVGRNKVGRINGNSVNNIYAPDFIPRYLSFNLKNSKGAAILPFSVTEQLRFYTSQEKSTALKPDFIISGEILFGDDHSCEIRPCLTDNSSDSLALDTLRGSINNIDQLFNQITSEIQPLIDIIRTGDTSIAQLKGYFLEDGNYEKAYESAVKSKNYDLALYYASHLYGMKTLLKGEIYFMKGQLEDAMQAFLEVTDKDSLNSSANYYLGWISLKKGRYQVAKNYFSMIDSTRFPARDLHYFKGLCYYYQDSAQKALHEFQLQSVLDPELQPDMYAYIGSIYKNTGDLRRAEDAYKHLLAKDPGNQVYRKYLYNLYMTEGGKRQDAKDDKKAGKYFLQAYEYVHGEEALLGAATSFVVGKDEEQIRTVINLASADTSLDLSSFYLDVSKICRVQRETNQENMRFFARQSIEFLSRYLKTANSDLSLVADDLGSSYFRLNLFDSAEYFYKASLRFNRAEPALYFNLAELQIMEMKFPDAYATLDSTQKRFHLDSLDAKEVRSSKKDFYQALYLTYYCQYGLLAHKDIRKAESLLKNILARYRAGKTITPIFTGWSFATYHNWVINSSPVSATLKSILLDKLCLVLPYSNDSQLSCEIN